MTALGAVQLERCHGYCQDCHTPQFAADRLLGIDGWLTGHARRMADQAGIHDPFRQAETLLQELAGWTIDAETIRRYCHQDAARARQGRGQRQALPQQFAQAVGDRELHIDAGKVNTPQGYRDVKVAVFACRQRGPSATAADYEQRDLPAPSVRAVIAEVEEASAFGDRLRVEATRLGVSGAGLSVLGDGAEWIGDLVAWHFPLATQVLDVYHGSEQLAQAGRAVFGEGEQLQSWLEAARVQMIGDGYWGVCEVVAALGREPEQAQRLGRSGGEVLNYFCGQRARLGYALRLRRGQAIGSGLVEGTIKQRVNMRMKRSGARWLAQHVGRFVELLAMSESAEWSEFWINMAA